MASYNQPMKVALGVTGGIAAYKAAEIVRLLQDCEVSVQVIMTRSAQQFVRPLTFAALTGKKVITDLFESEQTPNVDAAIEHIAVAQEIDALVVAPATADIIAKFANGIADDFLSTLYLATKAPVVVAPAMNVNMWQHAATQENVARLRERGVHIVEPDSGYLACGMVGAGRLAANETVVAAVMDVLHSTSRPASQGGSLQEKQSQSLTGETVLITAGPTREPIDPVRYIGNRSSGKMGYALADAALALGARVILISGPTGLKPPTDAKIIQVQTTDEMRAAVLQHLPEATIVIKAAAVADYKPRHIAKQKIKRGPSEMNTLELEPTADIVAELAKAKQRESKIIIGFAAETENVLENARKKLFSKSLDAIVVNDVGKPGIGFDSDRNAVTILSNDEVITIAESAKSDIAAQVLKFIVGLKQKRTLPQGARVR